MDIFRKEYGQTFVFVRTKTKVLKYNVLIFYSDHPEQLECINSSALGYLLGLHVV